MSLCITGYAASEDKFTSDEDISSVIKTDLLPNKKQTKHNNNDGKQEVSKKVTDMHNKK